MRRRLLALIVLFLIDSSTAFNKCCRDGEFVIVESIEDNNLSPQKHFSCQAETVTVKAKSVKSKRESDQYVINNSSSLTEMIAYNVVINENTHWPACGDNALLSHAILSKPTRVSPSTSCVDIMAGEYFMFTCDERHESTSDLVDVKRLRKCCDRNSSYDVVERRCVGHNETTLAEEFRELFDDNVVMFESGIPQCKPDEVLVEYHSLVHSLNIVGDSLIIDTTNHNDSVLAMRNSFCVESVNGPAADGSKLVNLRASSKWIAKACRPSSICNEMPCVRKCCREGERMVHENVTFCEEHDTHLSLNFHFFDIRQSPEQPDAMEPTGEFIIPQNAEQTNSKARAWRFVIKCELRHLEMYTRIYL